MVFLSSLVLIKLKLLFKFLKVDSIHLSSRSLLVVSYLKVVAAQNHQTILSYQTFGSKESYLFFATEHSVVKNEQNISYILVVFSMVCANFDSVFLTANADRRAVSFTLAE